MAKKPTYEELEKRVKKLEREAAKHKEVEEGLRESEERYRLLIENIPSVSWVTSEDAKTIFISPNVERIYGYSQEEIYEEGEALWFGRIHPDDVGLVRESFRMMFRRKKEYNVEYRIQRKDGEWIWIHDMAILAFEEDNVRYAYGVFSDITEKQKAEEALREREEQYRQLAEISPDAIVVQCDGILDYANPAAVRMFSASGHEELKGRPYLDLVHPDDRAESKKRINKVVKKGWFAPPREHRVLALDNHVIDVESTGTFFRHKGRIMIQTIFRDITERKRAEEALRESEQKYRTLAHSSLSGVFIHQDSKYVFVNDRFAEMHGYEPEELLGRDHLDLIHLDQREIIRQRADKRLKGEEVPQRYEIKRLKKDGEAVWHEIMVSDPIMYGGRPAIMGHEIDITERKRAEEALREGEERFVLFMDHFPGVVFIKDLKGRLVYVNKAYEDRLGYKRRGDWYGKTDDQLWPPEAAALFGEKDREVLSKGRRMEFFDSIPYPDGQIHTQMTTKFPVLKDGKPVYLAGIGLDITDLKQTEDALRESEERFRAIFEQAAVGVGQVETETGRFLRVNQKYCDIVGYTREEMTGMTLMEITHPDDLQPSLDNIQRLIRGEIRDSSFEKRYIHKDGSIVWVNLTTSAMWGLDEKPNYHIAVVEDITQRKLAYTALREMKENLDKAQEIAHIGNWSRDMKLNQDKWSDELYRILGLIPGEPAQPSFDFLLSRVHPADRERVSSVLKKAVEKKGSFDFEFRTVPIEGSERIIRDRGGVECDESGTPVRIFGTDQDITETRRLQAQLQEAEKMEAIATLAGGIAHQFNNALTPIIGHIGLLEMTHSRDEKTMASLKDMKVSGHRMANLTSQLLAYARGGKYEPRPVSLSDFVEDTLPLIEHTLDPAVRVETDLPLDLMDVNVDASQIQMVLSAIVVNSNEAIEGPGRIRISTRNMDLDKQFIKDHPDLRPGPYVCLSIEDDGKGMDEETRAKIFDPFFTTHFIGRGLGMASVYGIIKNHNGTITVDSELGKGTVVRIYLPAVEDEEGDKEGGTQKPAIDFPKSEGTILVIEDEEEVMMMIRQTLQRLGYRVLEAKTGNKAIKLAKTFEGDIDLALLDIKLPDIPGDKVYPLIMEARPGLKVIVCSGYGIEGPTQDILDAGAQGFIQKPFLISVFADKLKEVLGRK